MKGLGAADESKVAQYEAQLEAAFVAYEKIFAKQAYLAGDEVTLADLFHLSYATFIQKLGYDSLFAKYPRCQEVA